ncbi:right-handed parallel beta-helix repeat-containing protein [Candidatus Aciduliprofundum boonei]|uniref:Fibronectin type III domain protein n=1 Tax=Aciduliprofundum boonei (strain DSM 19572 / T469) TaxID=439481 RepID=B5I9M8_ACIB4|nr:right-handed parallel beta-helix repeat-containing protein [Candidatus Aciduliprofundum boonei]ADD08499.1 Fibronectin type III domain protein [Aciduliprofundum boonei T469]EDY36838.1 Periplasmic copper-binding protein (NosD) [Aciduliprofundum boonei T469]HII54917.1 copper ABC transporter substrate-binding protein [Candidatus Aciduliprofundum boonei]
MKNKIVPFIVLFLMLGMIGVGINSGSVQGVNGDEGFHFSVYKFHYKVRINNDKGLKKFVEKNSFSGNGTEESPYVISINISNSPSGIYIGNTSSYFILKNSKFSHFRKDWYGEMGIVLNNVKNAEIQNISFCNYNKDVLLTLIYIINSSNIKISHIYFYDSYLNGAELWIYHSSHISAWDLTGMNMKFDFWTSYSDNISISDSYFNSHVGLVGYSENITIKQIRFLGSGLNVIGSYNVWVENNTFSGRASGVSNIGSYYILVKNNRFFYNRDGIYVEGLNFPVHNNEITGNLFAYSEDYGIELSGDGSNYIWGNIFLNSTAKDGGYTPGGFYWNYTYAPYSFWNSSSIGNYWDNWANKNNTNDKNHDGIVDYPYKIPGHAHAVDYYPLKKIPFNYSLPPSSPRNLTIKDINGHFKLSWKVPSYRGDGILEYRIYRDGKLIANVGSNLTTYTDNISDGKEHVYWVSAVGPGGESAMSNEVRVLSMHLNYAYVVIPIGIVSIFIVGVFIWKKKVV